MDWIPTKFNNFLGIQKDTRKTALGSFEEVLNLDIRDKVGDLNLRKGYDIKYNAIESSVLSTKKVSNVEYLKSTSFWIDDQGGQEITVTLTKQRVAAVTTLTPNYFDMLGVWIRPYWDGSGWVDEWHWLNEIIITKITAIDQGTENDELALYLQAESTDNDLFKNWSILHYSGTDYTVVNEISAIFKSRDSSYQYVRIHDYNNSWAVNEKVILMKNYFPPAVLNNLFNDISASDIVFHKTLDDLRIGFGGQENRLGMGIGFRDKYFWSTDRAVQNTYYQGVFLDPYNIISDFDNSFTADVSAIPKISGNGFDDTEHFYKITALLDGVQEYLVVNSSITPSNALNNLSFTVKGLIGAFNKRFTDFRIYIANSISDPYYLIQSIKFADSDNGTTVSIDLDGNIYETVTITKDDYDAASEEINDVLGYSTTDGIDYVRSWDKAINIEGKAFYLNPYIDKRYENIISYSEVKGSSSNMPDVAANSYHDVNDFDGDAGLGILESPNGYLGVWSDNKFQLLNPITGKPLGLGTIYKGAVSKDSIVNLGQELIWASEYDIVKNRGYQIADVSEGSIRGDYRDISNKNNVIATREEKGNCYRFFDGSTYEYILTDRGWIRWSIYNKPTNYIIRKDGEVWYMKDGAIYYPNAYQDRKDASSYSSISFKLKSMPIDIRLLDSSIKYTNRFLKYTNRFYVHAFHIYSSEMPIGATLKIYLDGVLYSTKTITGLSDVFYRIPQGATCKLFQFELSGDGYEELNIYNIELLWKPIKVGAINVGTN